MIKSTNTQYTAKIYSSEGKLVQSNYLFGLNQKIDVSYLENGIYIIKFETNEGMLSKKFIKQ